MILDIPDNYTISIRRAPDHGTEIHIRARIDGQKFGAYQLIPDWLLDEAKKSEWYQNILRHSLTRIFPTMIRIMKEAEEKYVR